MDERRRERVVLAVSADELAQLDDWARTARMTRSDVIRAALGLVVVGWAGTPAPAHNTGRADGGRA